MRPDQITAIVEEHRDTPDYLEGVVMGRLILESDFNDIADQVLSVLTGVEDHALVQRLAEAVRLSHDGPAARGMYQSACEAIGAELVRCLRAFNRIEVEDLVAEATQLVDEPPRSAAWHAGFAA